MVREFGNQMIMPAFDLVKFFFTRRERKKLCDGGGPWGHVSRDLPSSRHAKAPRRKSDLGDNVS